MPDTSPHQSLRAPRDLPYCLGLVLFPFSPNPRTPAPRSAPPRDARRLGSLPFPPILALLLPAPLLLLATPVLSSTGTIVFATIGRCRYAFDIFSLPLSLSPAAASKLRLTDGTLNLYLTPVAASRREVLEVAPLSPGTLSPSRTARPSPPRLPPSLRLYRPPRRLPMQELGGCLYSTHLPSSRTCRLTPPDIADFSLAVSPSGEWTAAASPGPAGWTGEVEDLRTDIYVFMTSDGSRRTLAIHDGGWPSWADETTIFFHRRDSDGWYGVYHAKISVTDDRLSAASVKRITPPGFHAFTLAPSGVARRSGAGRRSARIGGEGKRTKPKRDGRSHGARRDWYGDVSDIRP